MLGVSSWGVGAQQGCGYHVDVGVGYRPHGIWCGRYVVYVVWEVGGSGQSQGVALRIT